MWLDNSDLVVQQIRVQTMRGRLLLLRGEGGEMSSLGVRGLSLYIIE